MNYIFRKSLRGKGKHCPILKNLASSYSTDYDLSVQGRAQKTLKKGRTLMQTPKQTAREHHSNCARTLGQPLTEVKATTPGGQSNQAQKLKQPSKKAEATTHRGQSNRAQTVKKPHTEAMSTARRHHNKHALI